MKTNTQKYFAHNGDVQAVESKMPVSVKKTSHKPLAYGEKSGHIHICTGDVELFEDEKGNIYAAVGGDGAMLQHVHESIFKGNYGTTQVLSKADHNPTVLAPNKTYKIGIHKRYNPFQKVWDKVID